MTYSIAFYCQSIPFTDQTIRLETSLGGSESALIGMANQLAARGHDVSVFTEIPDPAHRTDYQGVQWYDMASLPDISRGREFDIFISLRFFDIMHRPIRAKYRAIWNQDILSTPDAFYSSLWQVDELIYVSDWQRDQYESLLKEPIQAMSFVTRNAVDIEFIKDSIEGIAKEPNRFIYISRPERGLDPLLRMWPKILKEFPDAHLYVCRYESMYEPNPNIASICNAADKAVAEQPQVHSLGNLGKADLYRWIASSELMLYPGVPTFNETSCIAAIEAQACETPMICSNKGGLMETLHDDAGAKIDGDAYSDEYQAKFIGQMKRLLGEEKSYQTAQAIGREWAENLYDFPTVAEEWESHFDEFFEYRYSHASDKIFYNALHYDDYHLAKHIAEDTGHVSDFETELESAVASDTPESYAEHAIDPMAERDSPRFAEVINLIKDMTPKTVLDFACGNGSMTSLLAETFPDADVLGVDFSSDLCERAERVARRLKLKNMRTEKGSLATLRKSDQFDLIFCGEFLEHCIDPVGVISKLRSCLTDGGTIVWTMPDGPFVELMPGCKAAQKGHRVHWDYNSVQSVFSGLEDASISRMDMRRTLRGTPIGHWIISHKKGGRIGSIDLETKSRTTRPYQSVSLAMIVRNEAINLPRCLESVRNIVDEMVICDMESTDSTREIAESYGATVIPIPKICPGMPKGTPPPGSFEWARNEGLKECTGDWVLWLDADEELRNPENLRKYLHGEAYNGYVIRQNHLMLDQPNRFDKPTRLWRNGEGYKFYGLIHEHCFRDLNEPITPTLMLPDVDIVHYGYITEKDRRARCRDRNMYLLLLDRAVYPERHLGQLLLAREYLNMLNWDIQDYDIPLTDGALPITAAEQRRYAETIVEVWQKHFVDWQQPHTPLMIPIYQEALKLLGVGVNIEINQEKHRWGSWGEVHGYIDWRNEDDRAIAG